MNATLVSNDGWFPGSWRAYPARQMPAYADEAAVRSVEARLSGAAPVAFIEDSARLRESVSGLAQGGRGFLLQGGDCAESFDDPVAEQVAGIVGLFDAMAERLRPVADEPLIEIARIAGQFAKPRSATVETHDGVALPAYRGDIVNGAAFDPSSRAADPQRITAEDLHLTPVADEVDTPMPAGEKWPLQDYLDRVERGAINEALEKTRYNRTAAAKLLGITFRAMRYRMERLGIK